MPENTNTENMTPDTEPRETQDQNLEKESQAEAPAAASNLPVPVRQRGFATEAIAKVVHFTAEFLKKCIKPLATEKNIEIGEAAARTAAKGFSDSFAGVACALSDLKEIMDKKSPQSAAMLEQATEKAKTLGEKMKTAGEEIAPKLKDLKDSEKLEVAKEKIDQSASATAHALSVGAEEAGKKLKKVAHDTGILIGELKEKAASKIEEYRAEESDEPDDTEDDAQPDTESAPGIAQVALEKVGEKIQSLTQFAGTGVGSEHEQSEFSKKIDEQLNKLGMTVSQKTTELQKKLNENIKNFSDAVSKKAAEESSAEEESPADPAPSEPETAPAKEEPTKAEPEEAVLVKAEPVKPEPVKVDPVPAENPAPEVQKSPVPAKSPSSLAKVRTDKTLARKNFDLRGSVSRTATRARAKSPAQSAKSARALRVAAKWAKAHNKAD